MRVYDTIGDTFNNSSVDNLMASGSTLLVSLDTAHGGPGYAPIVAGDDDGTILRFLRAVNRSAFTYHLNAIYFCFQHEADNPEHAQAGSPAEFVRAWDHVHQLATSHGLDWNQGGRLHWVMILTHFAYLPGHSSASWPRVSAFWPGRSEVDIIGVDGYNTGNCRSAKPGSNYVAGGTRVQTPADLFGSTVSFAQAQGGMPVFVTEWASVPYSSSQVQPGFIRQMQSYVAGQPEIRAALYWNDHGAGNGCDYAINHYPQSLSALSAMGQMPGLQARPLI